MIRFTAVQRWPLLRVAPATASAAAASTSASAQHDQRVVPAELEHRAPVAEPRGDLAPDGDAAGEGDDLDRLVGEHRVEDLEPVAGDDDRRLRRVPGLDDRAAASQSAASGVFSDGLRTIGRARGDRGRDLVRDLVERMVERRDRRHEPYGLSQRVRRAAAGRAPTRRTRTRGRRRRAPPCAAKRNTSAARPASWRVSARHRPDSSVIARASASDSSAILSATRSSTGRALVAVETDTRGARALERRAGPRLATASAPRRPPRPCTGT